MRTPVCELLGIVEPIVQAPIGTAAVPRLAVLALGAQAAWLGTAFLLAWL